MCGNEKKRKGTNLITVNAVSIKRSIFKVKVFKFKYKSERE